VDVSEDFTTRRTTTSILFVSTSCTRQGEDQNMFGSDRLVAPLFEPGAGRRVYPPPGAWIDYQGSATYNGGRWHTMKAGVLPVVLLVRGGAIVPHAAVAQHTGAIDWKNIELRVYGGTATSARGLFELPDGDLHTLTAVQTGGGFTLREDPLRRPSQRTRNLASSLRRRTMITSAERRRVK
jgi:alpha-glucosidase (family GH31 glycosyl hydrolase)